MMARLLVLPLTVGLFAGVLSTTGAYAQTADPAIGTWTLNVAKSSFEPGPPMKGGTVTFTQAGEGVRVVADIVDAAGTKTHTEYTATYDGKDVPITGQASAETVSLKRIDASTVERTDKKGGKVVSTWVRKVSPDGKTMTVSLKGVNPQGQTANYVMTFDKKM